jgi:hypothetical protein
MNLSHYSEFYEVTCAGLTPSDFSSGICIRQLHELGYAEYLKNLKREIIFEFRASNQYVCNFQKFKD